MLLPAMLGMWPGQRLRDELSQEGFRAFLFAPATYQAIAGFLLSRTRKQLDLCAASDAC